MTLKKYAELLTRHDWYYMYSDDHRAYERGKKESLELRLALTELEEKGLEKEAKEVFNLISPPEFSL